MLLVDVEVGLCTPIASADPTWASHHEATGHSLAFDPPADAFRSLASTVVLPLASIICIFFDDFSSEVEVAEVLADLAAQDPHLPPEEYTPPQVLLVIQSLRSGSDAKRMEDRVQDLFHEALLTRSSDIRRPTHKAPLGPIHVVVGPAASRSITSAAIYDELAR